MNSSWCVCVYVCDHVSYQASTPTPVKSKKAPEQQRNICQMHKPQGKERERERKIGLGEVNMITACVLQILTVYIEEKKKQKISYTY